MVATAYIRGIAKDIMWSKVIIYKMSLKFIYGTSLRRFIENSLFV